MEIHEYISDLVAKIAPTITIDSVVDNGDGTYTITACNTYYLKEGKTITIDSVDYRVKNVIKDVQFLVQGSVLPTAASFALYTPFFFHGTPIAIQKELSQIKKGKDKTPVFLLHEIVREQNFSRNFESVLEKEVDVQLFIMDTSKFQEWTTDDHYNVCIVPMRSLLELFLDEMVADVKLFDTLELEYEVIPRANFGQFTDSKGNLTELYTDYFSGNQLNVTIKIRKQACSTGC